jgi:hypothetical protein
MRAIARVITRILWSVSLGILFATNAHAQLDVSGDENPAFAVLEASIDDTLVQFASQGAVSAGQEVINGVVVDVRDFEAVLGKRRAFDPHPTCTAALVGPATVLIAAHCVDGSPRIRLKTSSGVVEGICKIAPGWSSEADTGSDLALCLLRQHVSGVVFERVSFTLPSVGQLVAITGFGCTEEGGQRDGVLRMGTAPAQNRPAGFAESIGTLYTIAAIGDGDAVLCPGDSGGPLFVIGATTNGPREVIAVNSATTFDRGVSLFAALGAVHNQSFIRSWASGELTPDASGQPIPQDVCGINRDRDCKAPMS